MRIYRVVVNCYREGVVNPELLTRIQRTFMLEAESASGAMKAGADHADSTASGAYRWVRFEPVKASPVKFPLEEA